MAWKAARGGVIRTDTMNTKQCRKCKKTYPLNQFFKDAIKADGLRGCCKQCDVAMTLKYCRTHKKKMRAAHRAWYAKNIDKCREQSRSARRKNRARWLLKNSRNRAKEKGLAFDLDKHWPELKKRIDVLRCELTGLPLDLNAIRDWNSPSIDRIDCSRGYTYDNVRIVCFAMNCAMGTWGENKLKLVLNAWSDKCFKKRKNTRSKCCSKPSTTNPRLGSPSASNATEGVCE